MDEAAAEQARARLVAKALEDPSSKKAALPDIVPGFKTSPLSLGKLQPTSPPTLFAPRRSNLGLPVPVVLV